MQQPARLLAARALEAEPLGERERSLDERRQHVPRLTRWPSRFPSRRTSTPSRVGEVWRVDYAAPLRGRRALARTSTALAGAAHDRFRIALVVVDVQNTFCTPGFELFVAGRSGTGALDDTRRLCEFVYRNLGSITQIVPTLDTHQALQIFHPPFLVDAGGEQPAPYTLVTAEDVEAGRWRVDPAAAEGLGLDAEYAQEHLRYYTETLERGGKYSLTVWPFHAHAAAGSATRSCSAVEEAIFFHAIARAAPAEFQPKGDNPLTEHYSVLGPEVEVDREGEPLGARNQPLIEQLLRFDAVVIAGQAKSHCVAWTIERPARRRERAGARARGEGLPARGLHVARRRAGLGRLHGRGRRGLRALRRGGRARRALDRADRVLARRRRRGRWAPTSTSSSRGFGR